MLNRMVSMAMHNALLKNGEVPTKVLISQHGGNTNFAIFAGNLLSTEEYGLQPVGTAVGIGGSRVERFWRGLSVSFIVHTRYRVFSRVHVLFV